MRRSVMTVVCLVATLAMVSGSPARAGDLSVPDPAGDATGFDLLGTPQAQSTPRPSDAELDILGMAWKSDAKELKIDLKLAKVGHPVGSVGYSYRLNFTHADHDYHFLYQVLGPPGSQTVTFVFREGSTRIECRCSGKVDGKTATLHVTAEIGSLGRALKASSGTAFGPGTKLTGVFGTTDRIVGFLVAVDVVTPPNATFTI